MGGNAYYGGLEEGFVDVSPLSDNCAAGTAEAIEQVKAMMVNGEWDVFSGVKLSIDAQGNVTKAEADLKDNQGNVIVAAGGASVADGVITGTMNYYVAGVQEA
jgi:basic membrane protein A